MSTNGNIPQKPYKPDTPWRGDDRPGRMARAFVKAFVDPNLEAAHPPGSFWWGRNG